MVERPLRYAFLDLVLDTWSCRVIAPCAVGTARFSKEEHEWWCAGAAGRSRRLTRRFDGFSFFLCNIYGPH